MPSALESFLSRNSVVPGDALPLVHSTRSYNLKSILSSANISPQKCNVFLEEELNYFFVGRPSYKYTSSSSSASHWELPCCFIFSADIIPNPDRIFPFDSGAFTNKRFPDYIGVMPRQEFEVKTPGAPEKMIGSFFGSAKDYLDLNPKSKDIFDQEFSLSPLDSEISAIYRLASEGASPNFDDRRFAIEIQSSQPVNLNNTKPLAVVLPEQYLDVESILNTIQNAWGAEPLGYPMFSLSVSAYYALIYKEVLDFYKRAGFIK